MKLLIFIVFIAICVQKGSSIHCYECSSRNNTYCKDPELYDNDTISNFLPVTKCKHKVHSKRHGIFFCRKIKQIIYKRRESKTEVVVIRGCGWARSPEDCYTTVSAYHIETVCQCFDDVCNGGPDFTHSFWIILTSLILLFSI